MGPAEEAGHERLLDAALQLASEHSTSVVLQRIVDLAADLTGARYAALGVLDEEGHRLAEFLTIGVTPEERARIGHLPEGHGILGVLIKDPRPLRLRELSRDPRSVGFPPNHPPMSSFLGAPVKARGAVFGNLYLTEKQGAEEFTVEGEHTLTLLAAQAGVAIENARLFEANASRERRLVAGRQISMAILENRDTAMVLGMVAARAREFTGSDLAMVATVVEEGEALVVSVAHGAGADAVEGTKLPMEGSLVGSVATTARSLVVEDLGTEDGPFRAAVRDVLPALGPGAFVPMAAGGRVFGTLVVARLAPARRYTTQDLAAVESLAAQAAVAMEYGRSQDQLRRLAVLEDRERIARDLHDGAIQSLFAVGMNLQATGMLAEGREVSSRIGVAVAELDRVILELRNYIFGLRTELSGEQLEKTLRRLAADFEERCGVLTVVTIDRDVAMRLQGIAGDLVQLTREALSNVSRHAQATTCRVSLVRLDGEAVLEVDDDGRGFDTSQPAAGMGLRHLRERVEKLGGGVELRSEPDSGTCVRVNVPL